MLEAWNLYLGFAIYQLSGPEHPILFEKLRKKIQTSKDPCENEKRYFVNYKKWYKISTLIEAKFMRVEKYNELMGDTSKISPSSKIPASASW